MEIHMKQALCMLHMQSMPARGVQMYEYCAHPLHPYILCTEANAGNGIWDAIETMSKYPLPYTSSAASVCLASSKTGTNTCVSTKQ